MEMKKGINLLLCIPLLFGFSVKELEKKEDTTKTKIETETKIEKVENFSIKNLEKEKRNIGEEVKKEGLGSLEKIAGKVFSFTSSDRNNYSFNYIIDENGEVEILNTSPNTPPYAIDEAKFLIAFEKFINDVYGSKQGFINGIDREINAVNSNVEEIISSLRFAQAIRELGHMAAVNIYYGGLSGEANKIFLQKIATNYVAGVIHDMAQYYRFTSETLEGKIMSDIIKTVSGLFLSRNIKSNEDYSEKITQDVIAGFYAEIALGLSLMKEAKGYIYSNNFEDLQKAYDRFKYGYVSAWASIEGFKYLANLEIDKKISDAFSEIVGSFIVKEIKRKEEKSSGGGGLWETLEKISEISRALEQLTSYPLSDAQKSQIITNALKQQYAGEAFRRAQRKAQNLSKIFWNVEKYNK